MEAWITKVESAQAINKWKYGRDYERYIGYLFERDGYHVVYNGALEGKADGGIDVFAFKDGFIHLIQCKRWRSRIGAEEIEKFADAVDRFENHRHRYERIIPTGYSKCKVFPMFYATNGYTDEAFNEAYWSDIKLKTQPFKSIREYPPVKCTILNKQKVYYLPFDRDFDKVHIGVYRGGCYKFTVFEAERAGYRYVNNPERPVLVSSKPEKPKPKENYTGLKVLAGVIIVAFVFEFFANDNPKSKSSSPPPTRTYSHETFRPSTQSRSEPSYRPIELPKPSVLTSLPETQSPILNVSEQPELVEEKIDDIPDKPSLDLPKSLDELDSESQRKNFEVEMEAARQRYEAYVEANHERWEAEMEAARQRYEAYAEANRERWDAEMQAAQRRLEESRRQASSLSSMPATFNETNPFRFSNKSSALLGLP